MGMVPKQSSPTILAWMTLSNIMAVEWAQPGKSQWDCILLMISLKSKSPDFYSVNRPSVIYNFVFPFIGKFFFSGFSEAWRLANTRPCSYYYAHFLSNVVQLCKEGDDRFSRPTGCCTCRWGSFARTFWFLSRTQFKCEWTFSQRLYVLDDCPPTLGARGLRA